MLSYLSLISRRPERKTDREKRRQRLRTRKVNGWVERPEGDRRGKRSRRAMIKPERLSPSALQRETMALMSPVAQCKQGCRKGDEEGREISRKTILRWERRSAHPRQLLSRSSRWSAINRASRNGRELNRIPGSSIPNLALRRLRRGSPAEAGANQSSVSPA